VTTAALCIAARDELRLDVLSGEIYETGIILCCTAPRTSDSLYCSSCQPRSGNLGAPYLVRHGYCGENRETFPIFEDAFKRYAALRLDANASRWGVDIYGSGADDESDGLDDYERERLGELP
jgi:hypothetical protein